MKDADPATLVQSLFAAAGIAPTEEELALFAMMYPLLRSRADRIYELDLAEQPWF